MGPTVPTTDRRARLVRERRVGDHVLFASLLRSLTKVRASPTARRSTCNVAAKPASNSVRAWPQAPPASSRERVLASLQASVPASPGP